MVCSLATVACSHPAATSRLASGELSPDVVEPYLGATVALASDRIDSVKTDASAVGLGARALGPSAVAIDTAAVQLAAATDLADARAKFGVLSEAIDVYMADHHLAPPAGVRAAFCPMAMRPWLQRDGAIRNPYYGSQMLTCGSFRN
jgi:hypothetical protein